MAESNQPHAPLTASQRRKSELIAELARARSGMTLHAGQAKFQADVPRRLKSSLKHHVGIWMAGALVTGGAISLLPARKHKVYVNPLSKDGKSKLKDVEDPKKPGFWMMMLGLLMPIIKPIATRILTRHLSSYLEGPMTAGKAANTAAAAI